MIKLLRYLKRHVAKLIFIVILLFTYTMCDLYLPNLMSDIVDNGIVSGDTSYILKIGAIMIGVALLSTICSISAAYLSSKVGINFSKDLRRDVFVKVSDYSLAEFDKIGTASLVTRTTNDINQIQQVVIMFMRMMIIAPLTCIGGIIMAVNKNSDLSKILFVVIPVIGIVIFVIGKTGMPLFKAMQGKLDRLNLIIRENLTGIRVIRAFDKPVYEKDRFDIANKDLTSNAIKVNIIMGFLMPVMTLILNITSIVVVWLASNLIDMGTMEVGDLMAYLQYIMQIMFSLLLVSMMFILIPRAQASAVRVNEVLEMETEIKEPNSIVSPKKNLGILEFKNVTFNYPNSSESSLIDVSFTAKPNEITAFIGSTGSGKSTIVNLIPRFYDATSGEILIDGVNIKDYAQDTLRRKIGLVPQKAVLFSGTISENIRYGKEDATTRQIEEASKVAQASEFISKMKDTYNSHIAQGGTNVSGGQKQRLAIARALVRKPQIYIFDDSFSALDFKTDSKLRGSLKENVHDATMIIVAQRVSTIMDADRILVLDEGKVVGDGTHKELLENCTVYQEIVSSQLSSEEASA
ncbi:MAG: ABC transporter ATP-binding protein [Clostridium sp.]